MVGKNNVGLLSCAAAVLLVAVLPQMSPAVPVSIDKATTFQTMEGMGAKVNVGEFGVRGAAPLRFDILPEAHSKQSSYKLIGLTILGVVFIFTITRLI